MGARIAHLMAIVVAELAFCCGDKFLKLGSIRNDLEAMFGGEGGHMPPESNMVAKQGPEELEDEVFEPS